MTASPRIPHRAVHRTACVLAAVILGLGALSPLARAQQAPDIPGASLANPAPDAGQYLGNSYKDEVAGFRIAPPIGARVISKAGSYDLLTFVQNAKSSGGTLQRIDANLSLDEYAESAVREMMKSFKAVQVQERRRTKFQDFPAIRLTTTMQAELGTGLPTGAEQQMNRGRAPVARPNEEVSLLRQQLIVQTRDKGFMVVTYYAPLRNREEATRTFEAVIGSFEILNSEDVRKRRVEAILLGKKWLADRSADEFRAKMNPQPAYFRMRVGGMNGTDAGYWWQTERDAARDGFKGIEIEVCSRSFPDDPPGSLTQVKYVSFWANARNDKGEVVPHYSMWDYVTRSDVRLPNANNPAVLEPRAFWVEESGTLTLEGNGRLNAAALAQLQADREKFIRDNPNKPPPPQIPQSSLQFHMIVNLSGDKQQRLPDGIDKWFPSQEAAALPKVFEYMWPRLVELNKPSEMSFAVYNSATKKLALRNLIVTGKRERITVGNRTIDAWKCVDELDPGSTTLWTDDAGRVLMMRTSDQTVMLPTTMQEMDSLWGARVRQWPQ
jgi:hypothetical protein